MCGPRPHRLGMDGPAQRGHAGRPQPGPGGRATCFLDAPGAQPALCSRLMKPPEPTEPTEGTVSVTPQNRPPRGPVARLVLKADGAASCVHPRRTPLPGAWPGRPHRHPHEQMTTMLVSKALGDTSGVEHCAGHRPQGAWEQAPRPGQSAAVSGGHSHQQASGRL